MIFVINNLKYNTDKMELISEKCKLYSIKPYAIIHDGIKYYYNPNFKLYKSKKGNFLMVWRDEERNYHGDALSEKAVKTLLLRYDCEVYEKIFGELEEA